MPDATQVERDPRLSPGALTVYIDPAMQMYSPSAAATHGTWLRGPEISESLFELYSQRVAAEWLPRLPFRETVGTQPSRKPARDSAKDFKLLLELAHQLSTQAKELKELREEVERLAERRVYSTLLSTLVSKDYELLRDIPITVERDDEETCISWFEVGVTGVSGSAVGALLSFEDRLLRRFTDLDAKPDSELGPLPSRWKRTLATAIRRV